MSENTEQTTLPDGIVGSLEEPERGQLQQLQAQANSCYNQIGQLEVQKAALLGRIGALEGQGQRVMQGIADRCGIEKGAAWRITPDNQIQLVPNTTPFPGTDNEG